MNDEPIFYLVRFKKEIEKYYGKIYGKRKQSESEHKKCLFKWKNSIENRLYSRKCKEVSFYTSAQVVNEKMTLFHEIEKLLRSTFFHCLCVTAYMKQNS